MSKQELTHEEYNKLSFAVRGDKKKYAKKLKDIGGRWNPRMKGGEGWLVPKENLENLKSLLTEVNISEESEITQIKSRKNQNKYRREVSDIEEVSSSESGSDSDSSSESGYDTKETGKILLDIEKKILPVKSNISESVETESGDEKQKSESDDEKKIIDPVKTEIINDYQYDNEQHFIEKKKFEDEKRAFELEHKKSTKQIESRQEQRERPNGDKKYESIESRGSSIRESRNESREEGGRSKGDKQMKSLDSRDSRESSESRERSTEQRGRESSEQRGRSKGDKQMKSSEQRGRESREQGGRSNGNKQMKSSESTDQRGRESSEQRGRSNGDKQMKSSESREQGGRSNGGNHQKTSDTKNVIKYYKSFSNKPSAFKEMYESDDNNKFSSSDCGDSSSDDFPYPNSPKKKAYKRDDDDYGTLFGKVNELQKRLYHVELKQKKKTER